MTSLQQWNYHVDRIHQKIHAHHSYHVYKSYFSHGYINKVLMSSFEISNHFLYASHQRMFGDAPILSSKHVWQTFCTSLLLFNNHISKHCEGLLCSVRDGHPGRSDLLLWQSICLCNDIPRYDLVKIYGTFPRVAVLVVRLKHVFTMLTPKKMVTNPR